MLLELRQLRIQPGQQLLLEDVTWQQFENILAELGEHRAASSQAIQAFRNWVRNVG